MSDAVLLQWVAPAYEMASTICLQEATPRGTVNYTYNNASRRQTMCRYRGSRRLRKYGMMRTS